jgi:hypothetical protein
VYSAVTPIVALTTVLARAAMTTRASTSRSRRSDGSNWPSLSPHAASTASSVFPTAMTAATSSGVLGVVAFAANAPAQMAGNAGGPRSTAAAMAMPVGGHTTVTCSATTAFARPSFAAAKYVRLPRSPAQGARNALMPCCAAVM